MNSAAEARSRFDPVPGYLTAASLELLARDVAESVTVAIGAWRRGEASPPPMTSRQGLPAAERPGSWAPGRGSRITGRPSHDLASGARDSHGSDQNDNQPAPAR